MVTEKIMAQEILNSSLDDLSIMLTRLDTARAYYNYEGNANISHAKRKLAEAMLWLKTASQQEEVPND